MKFSINVSNTGLMVLMALVLGALLITDINAHRVPHAYAPSDIANRVVTKEFVLVDDQGATRARIGMNDKGSPCMQLFDRNGQQRAQLRLNGNDIPSLRLYDENGTLRSAMSFNLLGNLEPGFAVFDQNGIGAWLNQMSMVGASGPVYDEDAPHRSVPVQTPFLWAGPDSEVHVPQYENKDVTLQGGIIHLDLRSEVKPDLNR